MEQSFEIATLRSQRHQKNVAKLLSVYGRPLFFKKINLFSLYCIFITKRTLDIPSTKSGISSLKIVIKLLNPGN